MQDHAAIVQRVLLRIEERLDDVQITDLIQYSGYSPYHFHRLFVAYAGESLKQYVKRLRLQKAAHRLNHSSDPVTGIALDAGYQTPSAFNKAFKAFFGTSPSGFKEQPPLRKAAMKTEPLRIEELAPLRVYCARHTGPYHESGKAWEQLMGFIYPLKIREKKNLLGKDAKMLGISYDDPDVVEAAHLRYDACITADDHVRLVPGIEEKTIAGGLCAVFLHKGSYNNLNETYAAIFAGWVKEHNVSLREVPIVARYLNRDPRRTRPENLRTEIYIPIQSAP